MAVPRARRIFRWLTYPRIQAWTLLGPGMLWLIVFFLVPLLIMLAYSFMPRGISAIRPLPGVTLSPFLAVRPAPWLPSGPLRLYTGANEEN